MSRRSCLTAALLPLTATALAACATSDPAPTPASNAASASNSASTATTTTTAPSTSIPPIGGMTTCTKDKLAQPASDAAQALGSDNVYTINDLQCADGWAVTSGLLASKQDPSTGAPTSFVFEQEGQFWVLQDKAKVCGTNPTSTTPPHDATIPAALFVSGCAAG